jgi:hypothetical protein
MDGSWRGRGASRGRVQAGGAAAPCPFRRRMPPRRQGTRVFSPAPRTDRAVTHLLGLTSPRQDERTTDPRPQQRTASRLKPSGCNPAKKEPGARNRPCPQPQSPAGHSRPARGRRRTDMAKDHRARCRGRTDIKPGPLRAPERQGTYRHRQREPEGRPTSPQPLHPEGPACRRVPLPRCRGISLPRWRRAPLPSVSRSRPAAPTAGRVAAAS